MSHYLSSVPLPFISILIPFMAALVIFALRLYHRIEKYRTGRVYVVNRRVLIVFFMLLFILNVVLTFVIWFKFRAEGASFYVLSSTGWAETLSGTGAGRIRALVQVDALGALSSVIMSIVALGAAIAALLDKKNVLSPTKTGFFLLTLCGVQGIFYSNGLIVLFICILLGQAGASGLYRGVPSGSVDIKRSFWYYLSRLVTLSMFLAGGLSLYFKYGTDNIAILATMMEAGDRERLAFVLLVVPILFLFMKHSAYVTDAACRCFFGMRAKAAFFIVFRIIFSLYGPMAGLDKIPALFVILGFLGILYALLLLGISQDPVRFTEKMEQYMKSLMLISLGVSMSGTYAAESMVKYGFVAIESMVSIWIMYLPLSATLSIICVHLKTKHGDRELWQYGCLFKTMPATGIFLSLIIAVMSGLPPFAGFAAKQFLYRASNSYSPFLAISIFISAILIMMFAVCYVSALMFRRCSRPASSGFRGESNIVAPLVIIFSVLIFMTSVPGFFFENCLTPAVDSLLNRAESINVMENGGGTE